MKKTFLNLLLPVLLLSAGTVPAQQKNSSPWPQLQTQMRPWTRWWWMGSAVDEKNLSAALQNYAAAGIGGVEITPIYGVKGFEDRYIDFLSPKWMGMLDFTVKKAASLGMGVDMNTGTGWPFGGPQITPEFAASRYIIQRYQVTKGQSLQELIVFKEDKPVKNGAAKAVPQKSDTDQKKQVLNILQAVTAYGKNGQVISLLDKVDSEGKLQWTAADTDFEVYALFSGKTMQKVKRAAPGGEGYTLDHLDKPAVNTYLKRFDNAFGGRPTGIRSFFNDSYEVYGANWTPSFFTEFKRLKGYDLSLYLRELTGKDSTSAVVGRVKSDYRETMGQLLQDNFTKNWTNWAHGYKGKTRNQSHGSPGNLLDLYAAVDIPETETFGSSYFPIPGLRRDSADVRNVDPDPMMSKFASSAAHTQGKTLVSSETFTWLTEHFKTSFSQAKPEAEQLFLSGINHIFYHGTTYTPADVPFPGWLFYASTNMVPANSLWPQLKGMNDYFSRCQSMLQSGKADNELLIYWPVYDQWGKAGGMDMPMKVHDVDVWLHPTQFYLQSLKLQQEGYAFDFASDQLLSQTKAGANGELITNSTAVPYRTLIIPECKLMPLQTLQNILLLAENGSTVIFQKLPEDVPGLENLENNRKQFRQLLAGLTFKTEANGVLRAVSGKGTVLVSAEIQQALADQEIKSEKLVGSGLKFIRRKLTDGYSYFLVNHTAKIIDRWIPVNHLGASMMLMDALTGEYGLAQTNIKNGQTTVRVQLNPGESIFLQTGTRPASAAVGNWPYLTATPEVFKFDQPWKLHFTEGGPVLPSDQVLTKLVSWTDSGDTAAVAFSGTGAYTTTINLPAKKHKEYVLELGQVNESAHVWINGKDAGFIWSIPYQKRIGKYLVAGKNTLKIEVVNLMANRIRDMDKKGIQWRNYHEINFVNINYKPFDASGWAPVSSGLIGPVLLKGYN